MKPMKAPIQKGDYHLVVSDDNRLPVSIAKLFNSNGELVHEWKCLARGQTSNWKAKRGDTPAGLYRAGLLTVTQPNEPEHIKRAFGFYFIDLIDMEGQERNHLRDGIGVHGGGSASPNPLAKRQGLYPSWGCLRFQNEDMEVLAKLYQEIQAAGNQLYVSVHQL